MWKNHADGDFPPRPCQHDAKGCGVMYVARIAGIILTGLVLSCQAAGAAGPDRPFQIGRWSGGAYTDDRTGAFSHCSAGVVYDSGLNLFVVSTAGHGWWLGFTDPHWSLTPNGSLSVKLRFDGRPPVDAIAAIPNGQLLLVPMPDDSRLIDTFTHSSQLTVDAQEPSFSLNLDGTSKVIAELTNCVRTAVALEAPARRSPPAASAPQTTTRTEPSTPSAGVTPPASPPPPTAPQATAAIEPPAPSAAAPASAAATAPAASASAPPVVLAPRSTLMARDPTEVEEVRLTKSFLMAAHLPNAHLVDTDKPSALASFRAVWRSDDASGAVKIIPPTRDVSGIGIATELISVDPRLCKGNFASARSRDVVDNAEVYRAVLSCSDGQGELTAQYFITSRRQGGFVVFVVIGDTGSGDVATVDGEKADLFDRAVIQAVGSED